MKVIQLRGTNATGKTTVIRQLIDRGDFCVKQFLLQNQVVEYHWDEERRIAVLGRYDTCVTGGIDGRITSREMLGSAIVRLLKVVRPEVLLFEGVVYGVTFKFAYELSSVAKTLGAEYIGITLIPPLEVALDRLSQRNGGKDVDILSVQNKWFSAAKAHEKLKAHGVNVIAVDTSKIPKGKMYRIVEDCL